MRQRELDAAGLTQRTARQHNFPILDRAIDASYPPGSTFKPVTALAAMEEHLVEPYSTLPCTGSYTVKGQTFLNWDPNANTAMTMTWPSHNVRQTTDVGTAHTEFAHSRVTHSELAAQVKPGGTPTNSRLAGPGTPFTVTVSQYIPSR